MTEHYLNIINTSETTVKIQISGYIGIPERWQNEPDMADQVVSTKEKMRKELIEIANLKAKKIELYIDSFGGSVNHGLAIYNALKQTDAEITTIYNGWSASIATVIGCAGDIRIAPDNCLLLIHNARGMAFGTKSDMKNYSEWLEKVDGFIKKVYTDAGMSESDVDDWMNRDSGNGEWMDANDAVNMNLLTGLMESGYQAAAVVDEKLFNDYNLPKITNMKNDKNGGMVEKILNVIGYKNDETLTAENTSLNERITELENQLNTANDRVTELENAGSNVEELTNQVETANATIAERDETITGLESQVNELTTQTESDSQTIENLTGERDDLQSQVNELSANALNVDGDGDNITDEPVTEEQKERIKTIERLQKSAGVKK